MLALLTGTTALVAHGPLTVTRAAVAYTPAASLGRADAPVMILPPVVRGAVIGGAAVGLVKTLLERQPKTYTTGEADVTKAMRRTTTRTQSGRRCCRRSCTTRTRARA